MAFDLIPRVLLSAADVRFIFDAAGSPYVGVGNSLLRVLCSATLHGPTKPGNWLKPVS